MTEFYDGSDGWANGDVLFADPTGTLWTPQVYDDYRPSLRRLISPGPTVHAVDLTGWRSLMILLGEWRGWVHTSASSGPIQPTQTEFASWTDIDFPELEGSGPLADGLFADEPEFIAEWERDHGPQWDELRSPEWIAKWSGA